MNVAAYLRLFTLAALWGGSFLLYRIVAPALGTLATTEARVGIAGVALLVWQALAGPRFAWRGHARAMLVVGIFNSAVPFGLFAFAAHALPASYLAILNATSPLFGAVIARVWLRDPLDRRRVAGIGLGLAGVATLVGLGPVEVSAATVAACVAGLAAAASYGFAGNYTRRRGGATPPATMATGSQLAAALVVGILLPFAPPPASPSPSIVMATLILAIPCTSVAYLLYFRLIRDVGAARALTVTFLIPVFAFGWAWIVLGEAPTPKMAAGALLVLVATWLATARGGTDARRGAGSGGDDRSRAIRT